MHGPSRSARDSSATGRTWTVGVSTRGACWRKTSVDRATEPGARREPRGNADDEDDGNEHQRARPRLLVPRVVWTDGVGEDLERKGGDRLSQTCRPELVAERRKQERRRLAGDTRDGDEGTGGNAGECCPKYYGYRSSPPWVAKRESRFPERSWNGSEHLLGGACPQRDHHRAWCGGARQRREVSYRPDE